MTKILITGGAGFIGTNLRNELVARGHDVFCCDMTNNERDHYMRCDVRNYRQLLRLFQKVGPFDYVYHLAAFFANQNSVDYPEISAEVDVLGHIKLLEYARLVRAERFIYASSGCAIYGSYPKLPISEDFVSMHLTTPYQINKMTGEMYCNFYFQNYHLAIVNCRFF